MEIIHENEYVYKMNDEIEPYLATHRQEGYIPGAEDHLHRKDTGIVGKIHVPYVPAYTHDIQPSENNKSSHHISALDIMCICRNIWDMDKVIA